ncbi:MAG: hypothetical protein ACK47B_02675 [Armatimonadota bacterium]
MNRSAGFTVLALVLTLGAGAAFYYRSSSPGPTGPPSVVPPVRTAETTPSGTAPGGTNAPEKGDTAAEASGDATLKSAAAEAGPAKPDSSKTSAAPVKKPAELTAPVITTTSPVPEYREAEIKLARFINALQLDRRERAVSLLSSQVPDSARQALLERRWLNPAAGKAQFERILFVKDLQIRPRGQIEGDTLKLYVIPRRIPFNYGIKDPKKRSKDLIGYLEIPMRREAGEWRVELLPTRTS